VHQLAADVITFLKQKRWKLQIPRRWLVLRTLCAVVWALELFWIQSLAFPQPPWVRNPLLTQSIRLFFDLLFASGLVFLVRRRFLTLILSGGFVVSMVVATYSAHFHWPFMPARILSEWQDGWKMRSHFAAVISLEMLLVLVVILILKAFLLLRSGRYDFPLPLWRILVVLGLIAYGTVSGALQTTSLRLTIGPNGGFGRGVYVYGYTLPWLCDILTNADVKHHSVRAKAYLSHHYDRITPLESPLTITNSVVVLQLESVSGHGIAARHDDQDIMPFARSLSEQSMRFRIQAFHRNGSCDMDYAATTSVEPYPGMVPYRLRGMPYTNTLPQFMRQHGFETSFFHGNTAIFYDRGMIMKEVGFDHVFFKEELASKHLPSSMIGVRDAALLKCLSEVLLSRSRVYLFGITLDTHTPFQQLDAKEMEIFPRPDGPVERYLNSLRYLDNCLRNFVNSMPNGTTLVLYGDHTTSMSTELFQSDIAQGKEYVEALIFQKGCNLASAQHSREQIIARDGSLNLLDVLTYLRNSVDCSDSNRVTKTASGTDLLSENRPGFFPKPSPGKGL
jgi:hypothetical protein